jgi:hypothetical protein
MRTMDKALLSRGTDGVGFLNATTRMMDVYQRGLLTIQRLRADSSQTVTVRHVTVEAGGQAVIGNIKRGGTSTEKQCGPRTKASRGKKRS